jgi:exopolysaccharide biosynthesis polyprenyl glycosylphosphotransferase
MSQVQHEVGSKVETQDARNAAAPALTMQSRSQRFERSGSAVDLAIVAVAAALPPAAAGFAANAAIAVALLVVRRAAWKWLLPRLSRAPRRTVLLVGAASANLELSNQLHGQMDIAGTINLNRQGADDVVAALHAHPVDTVAIQAGRFPGDKLDEVLKACETEGVEVWMMPELLHPELSRVTMDQIGGRPMVVYSSTPAPSWQRVAKRAIDIAATGFALCIIGPLLILPAMIAIKITAPGPIFFGQIRVGRNGRLFKMWKLRSMVVNAEKIKMDLMASNDMDGPVFKMKKDPRVTPVGRIMRKLSIDELPQLWNVLRGEMSLVGPRPAVPKEVAQYQPWQRRRLSVTPGLTCIWQVSGRNKIGFEEWMKMDLRYIDSWSLGQDLKLIALTIPVAAVGYGAS